MVQPIDYSGAFASVSPLAAFNDALKVGASVRALDMQQAQQEAEAARQTQMQADIAAVSQKPTAAGISQLVIKYPQLAEPYKKAHEMMTQDQRDNLVSQALPIYAAAISGKPDIAKAKLEEMAVGMENSGDQKGADGVRTIAKLVELSPGTAAGSIGKMLSVFMGADRFAEVDSKLGSERRAEEAQPANLREIEAKAKEAESKAWSAAVAAKWAESNAAKDLEKKGWDIKKIASDIEVQNANVRIAAANAATARANSETDRARLELQREEAIQKRDDLVRAKIANVEAARASTDNALSTIDRLLSNPALDDVVGSLEGSDLYPNTYVGMMPIPGTTGSDDRANAIALIDTLKSQVFLAQVPAIKGTGNLSDAEGARLEKSLQSLSRRQGEKQFRANLKEAQRLMLKARKNIAERYGVPDTVPDTPAASASPDEIEALVRKYGAAP